MTGAGFGGSTINLVRGETLEVLRRAIERDYRNRTGLEPTVIDVDAVAGAGWIE
jgi:galactokinase